MKQTGPKLIDRRKSLALLGGAGAFLLLPASTEEQLDAAVTSTAAQISCTPATPQVTEGPYWVDEKLFRSDIRTDPTTGVARQGVPLALAITVQNTSGSSCVPLTGAYVDIWQCDAVGLYSDESTYNPGGGTGNANTKGQKFLRGYQITDDNGQVQFTTIYPGWYSGRTIHIHVRVRTYSGSTMLDEFTSQLFFDDSVTSQVLKQAPYNTRTTARDTTNTTDNVYETASNPSRMLLALTQTDTGYAGSITIGVTVKTATATQPAIASGGVVNGASGAAGIAPGSWVTIYGSNLASSNRVLTSSDVTNNALPASLGGVSVQIDGKAAFPYYVSPTQINVLAPGDTNSGTVAVVVTNSAGSSSAVNATLQNIQPGLFTSSNYVDGVRASDGVVIDSSSVVAKSGDVIEL